MRLLPRILVVVAFVAACGETKQPASSSGQSVLPSAAAPAPPPVVRFLALGDSFTIGTGAPETSAFPARLTDRWRATKPSCALTLQNVAVNGYTTDDLIRDELPVIASFKPTFVTLAIGANDIVQGLALDVYRQNVRRILDAAKASGARVVVLPQPDWPKAPTAATFGAPGTLAEKRTSFNAALAEEARATGAEWVDLLPLMQQQAEKKQLSADGLHPSAEAYDAWAGELARVVASPCI